MNAILRKMGWVLLLMPCALVQAAEPVSTGETVAMAGLDVSQGWIRSAPPQAPVRAGYVRLRNMGGHDIVIDAVHSEAFGAIEIHEMHDVDGVMRMRRIPSLTLAPEQALELAPGGLHLMLFRPAAVLGNGDHARLVFSGPQGDLAEADFVVREPTQ